MFQVDEPNSNTAKYLIGDTIDHLPLHLIKKIDILRLYYNFPKGFAESRKIASIVNHIEENCRQNSVRMNESGAIRVKLKRLVKTSNNFISKRKLCGRSHSDRRKQEEFHRKIYNDIFNVTHSSQESDSDTTNSDDHDHENGSESDYTPNNSNSHDSSRDSDPEDNDSNPESHDSDPDYDPNDDFIMMHEKKPIPSPLIKEISKSRGSFRLCESLLNAGVKINGGNPKVYGLSKSNLWAKVTSIRATQKRELHESLASSNTKIIVQFDGKQCSKLNARHLPKEERFIVIAHTIHGDIPLGFYVLDSKSGRNCADQILNALTDHNLLDRVVGIVCDTENTNTGCDNGTCRLVEDGLEADLLYTMCRHHLKEIQVRDVFTLCFGASQASHLTTFDMLIENWNKIKSRGFSYSPIAAVKLAQNSLIKRMSKSAIDIISSHAKSKLIRDDYAELNDLVLKFLGVETESPFRVVGARNNARWMCRILYAFKTYLFRDHLQLDEKFLDSLERFCIFIALIYAKHWNVCSITVDAPYNDLQLMKELYDYIAIDEEIADVAMGAHERHLWYLSDELIVLSLFSNKVSTQEKIRMVQQLTRQASARTENSIKRTTDIDNIPDMQLHQFISSRSFFLFERLELDTAFLNENPENWNNMSSFKNAKKTIEELLNVVNDSSERALQLGSTTITNQRVQSEERLQDFIISTFRKKYLISSIYQIEYIHTLHFISFHFLSFHSYSFTEK